MSQRIAYFDCFSGASGDMLVGAMLDAGVSLEALQAELAKVPLMGYTVTCEHRIQQHLAGTKFNVHIAHEEHHHRHLADIEAIFAASSLPAEDVARILAVFRRLARAEAKVHGTSIEEVHFHEVGAVDSIVDIAGAVIGLRLLGVDKVYASSLPLGSGMVQTSHGPLPVPAPAVLELLAEAGAPTRPLDAGTELVTPTGAAILCELAEFRQPAMRLQRVGYGFGTKLLPWPNVLRLWIGEPADVSHAEPALETVAELACNIDDMSGQGLGFAMERLFAAGALDVWFTPIQMKKDRPAVQLGVLCRPEDVARLSRLLLEETTTFGVRHQLLLRYVAGRSFLEVNTPWGPVRAKAKLLDGQVVSVAPEYESCAQAARQAGVPLAQVYEAVLAGWRAGDLHPLDK
jgi:hypothetical protein